MSAPESLSPQAQAWARENGVSREAMTESIARLREALDKTKRHITYREQGERVAKALKAASDLSHWLPVLLNHPDFTPTDDRALIDRLQADLERLLSEAGMNPRLARVADLIGENPPSQWTQARPKRVMNKAGFYRRIVGGACRAEYRKLTGHEPSNWTDHRNNQVAGDLRRFIAAIAQDVGLDPIRDPARLAKGLTRNTKNKAE